MNESRTLAQFVTELRYETIPSDVINKAKDLILDQVGVMLGASTLPWSRIIEHYVRSWGCTAQDSTVVNYGYRTKVENAVFANCSFGHGFEYDDVYLYGNSHPGCIVVPTSLAMAERENATGQHMILAAVAGYEVMGRINSVMTPSCTKRGFHAPTSISGPFGAAAVAGKLLGFDQGLMLHALADRGKPLGGRHGIRSGRRKRQAHACRNGSAWRREIRAASADGTDGTRDHIGRQARNIPGFHRRVQDRRDCRWPGARFQGGDGDRLQSLLRMLSHSRGHRCASAFEKDTRHKA